MKPLLMVGDLCSRSTTPPTCCYGENFFNFPPVRSISGEIHCILIPLHIPPVRSASGETLYILLPLHIPPVRSVSGETLCSVLPLPIPPVRSVSGETFCILLSPHIPPVSSGSGEALRILLPLHKTYGESLVVVASVMYPDSPSHLFQHSESFNSPSSLLKERTFIQCAWATILHPAVPLSPSLLSGFLISKSTQEEPSLSRGDLLIKSEIYFTALLNYFRSGSASASSEVIFYRNSWMARPLPPPVNQIENLWFSFELLEPYWWSEAFGPSVAAPPPVKSRLVSCKTLIWFQFPFSGLGPQDQQQILGPSSHSLEFNAKEYSPIIRYVKPTYKTKGEAYQPTQPRPDYFILISSPNLLLLYSVPAGRSLHLSREATLGWIDSYHSRGLMANLTWAPFTGENRSHLPPVNTVAGETLFMATFALSENRSHLPPVNPVAGETLFMATFALLENRSHLPPVNPVAGEILFMATCALLENRSHLPPVNPVAGETLFMATFALSENRSHLDWYFFEITMMFWIPTDYKQQTSGGLWCDTLWSYIQMRLRFLKARKLLGFINLWSLLFSRVDYISIASKFTLGLFLFEFQLWFFDVCFNLCLWIARVSSRPSCDLPFQGRNAPAFQVQVGFIKTIRRLKIFVRQCLLEWRLRCTRPAHYLFERPPVADELKSSRVFSSLLSSLGATLTIWRASSLLLLSFKLCCFCFCSFVFFTHVSTSVPDWLSISECPQPIA